MLPVRAGSLGLVGRDYAFCLQVQDLTLEITDLLRWLEHVQLQLFISKPSWSQPEATKNQLAAHLVSPLPFRSQFRFWHFQGLGWGDPGDVAQPFAL